MASYKYSTKIGEKEAAAVGIALPISTKQAIEICSFIRGKKLERAKVMLSNVIDEKIAVPFKRFTDGVGHRKGKIASGRYPKKACSLILNLMNSAQANAQFKGLSSVDLMVRHISAQKSSNTPKYGRRRAFTKRTSIEIVLSEAEKKPGKKGEAKAEEKETKEEPKTEEKKEATPVKAPVPEAKAEAVKKEENIIAEKKEIAPQKEIKPERKKEIQTQTKKPEEGKTVQ